MADNESKEINTEEKPKFRSHLNEGYWFDVGKRLVDGAETNLNTSAEKFEKLILWFWGIYTTIVGLGAGGFTVFAGKSISIGTLMGLVLPSVILLIAYWLTTAASTSAMVEFEHRSPDSIREAFMDGLKTKGRFYTLARLFAFLACLAIPLTIFLANRTQSGDFEVLNTEANGDSVILMISGFVPKKSQFELTIHLKENTILQKGDTDTGHFAIEVPVPITSKSATIRLWWNESDGRGASREKVVEIGK
jgi:hypothetical protein